MSSKMVLDAIGFNPAKSSFFGEAVQNVSELSAIVSSQIEDKQLRLTEDEARIYRYDAQSLAMADTIKIVIPNNLNGTDAGRWILQSVNDHSQLINLGSDDHNQYIHNAVARLVTAIHTFNPVDTSAPFILGENAQGQKIIGLNADFLDGKSIEELVLASLIGVANGVASLGEDGKVKPTELLQLSNGMPAYTEPVGNNLVSIASMPVNFSAASAGTRNIYLNYMGDIASNNVSFRLPRNAMITAVVVASSTIMAANTNCSFQVRKNDVAAQIGTYTIPSGSSYSIKTGLNILLNAGDEIQAYVGADRNLANPCMTIELVWRD